MLDKYSALVERMILACKEMSAAFNTMCWIRVFDHEKWRVTVKIERDDEGQE